jgi:Tachylectin
VANAGSTGWGQGLTSLSDPGVQRLTSNLVATLRHPQGALVWFKDEAQNGTGRVTDGQVLDRVGWSAYLLAFSGADEIAYAVDGSGYLYRFPDRSDGGSLDPGGVQTIGRGGWNEFTHVFSGGAGVIYAIAGDGTLKRYRDPMTGADVGDWQDISPPGWATAFRLVFSGGGGRIYAVGQDGVLNVFVAPDNGPITHHAVGQGGWGAVGFAFPAGRNTFYAIDRNGDLNWFADQAGNGAISGSGGAVVGRSGWATRRLVFSTGGGNIFAVTSTQLAPAPIS